MRPPCIRRCSTCPLGAIHPPQGLAIRDTPEFESYRRTYEDIWGVLEGLLAHLEAVCRQYAVPLALVNGRSLADLAVQVQGGGYSPQMEDLLVCLSNIQEVAAVLKQPGRCVRPGAAAGGGGNVACHCIVVLVLPRDWLPDAGWVVWGLV